MKEEDQKKRIIVSKVGWDSGMSCPINYAFGSYLLILLLAYN